MLAIRILAKACVLGRSIGLHAALRMSVVVVDGKEAVLCAVKIAGLRELILQAA